MPCLVNHSSFDRLPRRRVWVQAELKRAKSTALQINLRSLRRKLNLGIQRLCGLQAPFMPAALTQLVALNMPPKTQAEEVPLIPPSALTESQRESSGCWAGLLELDKEMRDAQCRSALASLRNQLHIKTQFLLYKENHARHQGINTRSRTIVACNESKIRLHSDKYQAAWHALISISSGVEGAVGSGLEERTLGAPRMRRSYHARRKNASASRSGRRNGTLSFAQQASFLW